MKNILQKLILISILLLFIPIGSALSFSNFSTTSTSVGSVNTGFGYFDNDESTFNYTGNRNVYVVAESTQIWIFEPISYSSGAGNPYALINSSIGQIKDAVVHNGYLYYIDNGAILKKNVRNLGSVCESTSNTSGGCVRIIVASGVGNTLRVHNNILYYTAGATLKHLDSDDNAVTDFALAAIPGGESQFSGFGVTTNGTTQAYVVGFSGAADFLYFCKSSGCTNILPSISSNSVSWATFFETSTYMYVLDYQVTGGSPNTESFRYITNGSSRTVDYATNNALALRNRAYVGGKSTIGLIAQTTTTYETFNSLEVGEDSQRTSEGSGLVSYISKTVDVPNLNYYNDSVIPINVDLKFIISNENHTNYANSLFWHLRARDPTGIEVEDHDLPVVCTQAQPWWDPLGVFTLFIIDNVEPWACDGTQTVQYSHTPGQFWINGSYEVDLTEQIPGTISVLSTDSWNIVNQSSTSKGSIVPPPGGSPDSQNPMKGVTDEFLSSGMMVVFIILIVFAAMGQVIGGLAGAVIGFGGGFLFSATFGLIPMWALFLFAILIITAFAVMMGKSVVGGGQD